ncbi:MAG TPA: SAM-dependent chlorinase/fluorinase [Bryobacteraceae bacterium]|nr:SAM-dependent chlorinase/fluorinase [Bryobacteraceae bacterium]
MKRSTITLLTDFGTTDHYVGAMKGVMLGISPDAQQVDISHEIPPYAIPQAAFTLSQAWKCFPPGTVHLVVVDPGVGSSRRAIVVEAAGHYFVAPDNGVLTMIYEAAPDHQVRQITAARFFREPVSRTFHGRDIFAPVAAHLANGVRTAELGGPVADYARSVFGKPMQTAEKSWSGTILKVDHFGNLITNLVSEVWLPVMGNAFVMRVGKSSVSLVAANYAAMDAGGVFVIPGSAGFLEVSANQASAAKITDARAGDPVELRLV